MTKKNNKKSTLSNSKLIILIIGILLVLITIYLLMNNLLFSSKVIATKYVEAVGEEKIAEQLSYTDVYDNENDFVTKNVIEKKEKNSKYKEVKSIDILNEDEIKKLKNIEVPKETKNTKVYVFKYTRKNIKSTKYIAVELEKMPNKFLIFQNWKVVNGDYLAKNVTIITNKNSEVYLDNVKLTNKYLNKDDSNEKSTYTIAYLLKKNVIVKIKLDDGTYLTKSFNPYNDMTIDVTNTTDFKLSTSSFKNLKLVTNKFIDSYIINAINNKKISDVKKSDIWSKSLLENKDFESFYQELTKSYSSKKITDFKVKEIDLSSSYLNNENNIKLLAEVKFSYKLNKKEKENTTYIDLTLVNENNILKIKEFSKAGLKYIF